MIATIVGLLWFALVGLTIVTFSLVHRVNELETRFTKEPRRCPR